MIILLCVLKTNSSLLHFFMTVLILFLKIINRVLKSLSRTIEASGLVE